MENSIWEGWRTIGWNEYLIKHSETTSAPDHLLRVTFLVLNIFQIWITISSASHRSDKRNIWTEFTRWLSEKKNATSQAFDPYANSFETLQRVKQSNQYLRAFFQYMQLGKVFGCRGGGSPSERMNAWKNEQTKEWTYQWTNELTNQWKREGPLTAKKMFILGGKSSPPPPNFRTPKVTHNYLKLCSS